MKLEQAYSNLRVYSLNTSEQVQAKLGIIPKKVKKEIKKIMEYNNHSTRMYFVPTGIDYVLSSYAYTVIYVQHATINYDKEAYEVFMNKKFLYGVFYKSKVEYH